VISRAAAASLLCCAIGCSSPPAAAPRFEPATGTAGAGSIGAAAATVTPDAPAIAELNSPEAVATARRDYGVAAFLGSATVVSGTTLDGVEVGGLSGITWVGGDAYLAISDDRGSRGPGRFYELRLHLEGGQLERGGLEVVGFTAITDDAGQPLERETFDMEGIAAASDGTIYISSEGEARANIAPFVARFDRAGRNLGWLDIADKFIPRDGIRGVRSNLAFESMTIDPEGRFLFTASENALQQDGPPASGKTGSPSRILKIDLQTGRAAGEYLYAVDRIDLGIPLTDVFHTSGLVDLIALDSMHLLALERSFVAGYGFVARIFSVCLEGATNVIGIDSLEALGVTGLAAVHKDVFLDIGDVGLRFDNLEGMTLGQPLGDGRRALVLISDNNFNAAAQITQAVAFSVPTEITPPR
jgi:hypothetical protein